MSQELSDADFVRSFAEGCLSPSEEKRLRTIAASLERSTVGGTLIDTGGRRYMVEIEASHDRILEILGIDPLTKLDGLEVGITL